MNPRPSLSEIRKSILDLIAKEDKPVLIGRVSVHLGWWATLSETEKYLEDLVAEGVLRHLTPEEYRTHRIRHAYTLSGGVKPV